MQQPLSPEMGLDPNTLIFSNKLPIVVKIYLQAGHTRSSFEWLPT